MRKKINFPQKLLLASPRGFCAGVSRAVEALNQAVSKYPNRTIYCYHQIVHNSHVVQSFTEKGVKFVDNLEEVPDGSILVFSSHGVSPAVRQYAINHKLSTIDATCPYVAKTHQEVKKCAGDGYKIIYLGKANHDEAIGTTGEAPESTIIIQTIDDAKNLSLPNFSKVALVTQTTLSFDETEKIKQTLKGKFANLLEPPKSDICQATQDRQNGVKEIIKQGAEMVIVLGSPNSSNSNKLKEVAENLGKEAVLLDDISQLNPKSLGDLRVVGLTAGASLPEEKITEAIKWFKNQGTKDVKEVKVADESRVNLMPVQL